MEIEAIVSGVFQNIALNVIEFLRLDPKRADEISKNIEVVGLESYEATREKGRGVLILTGHFGNWDLLCVSQAAAGRPMTIISKKLKPAWLNDDWMKTRSAYGVEILPERGVFSTLIERLHQGKTIGFVIDQHLPQKKGGILVPFFGRDAWTTPGLARLAMRSGAPVLPVFMFRMPGGKHRVEIGEEIPIVTGVDDRETEFLTTVAYNRFLEKQILRAPDQWLWLHKRWKING